MIACVSVENMRNSDAYTISNHVPGLELMHRAAFGVFKAVKWQGSTAIVVGPGNNGGDGFALACILAEKDFDCTVFTLTEQISHDSAFYAQKALSSGVVVAPFTCHCLNGYDIIVDCLLGTGFHGVVREPYKTAIHAINDSRAYVVSVDINSGMDGNTGNAELAVKSDLTVTIGYVKTGLITQAAGKYIKRLVCADIGIKLIQQERQICTTDQWHRANNKQNLVQCPQWLDMNLIDATGTFTE